MSKKKEKVIIGILIVLLLTLTVGVSYAAFSYSGLGSKVNTITTGSISMTYEETDNVISLDKALPTTDKTGKTLSDYFEFTVTSSISGDTNINYEITAKEQEGNTFSGDNVKLYLTRVTDSGEEEVMAPEIYNEEINTNSFTGRPANEMSLYTSSMNASESNTYRLRMYVKEEYNPQGDGGNKIFNVKVNVYGKDGLSMEDRMMRTAGSEDFHAAEYKSKITSIITKGNTEIPSSGIIEQWDISEKQNGSVIAYIEDDGTGSGTYKLTIGGEGKIVANYDMSSYFESFSNLTIMNLSYLDTSMVNNMSFMFTELGILELNLSNFDTSNVTNMSNMFYGNTSLAKLDLSSFDTSNVTDMSNMFFMNPNLTELDLSNFDTSNVTDMSFMFSSGFTGTTNLEKIIFGINFDTSNVTNMSRMFLNCSNLQFLDLSTFNTSNVIDMASMFSGCINLIKLDLSSFDTSKVTSYNSMFKSTTNITEILVTRDKWTIPNTAITESGVTDFTYV